MQSPIRSFAIIAVFVLTLAVPSSGVPGSVQAAQDNQPAAAGCVSYLFGSGSTTGGKSITLRVKLTAVAGSGGVTVGLSSSDAAITIPATVLVPDGQQDHTFAVSTNPVVSDTSVQVSASSGGCAKGRSVLIKAPILKSLSVQSVMRGGGSGKVTVCMTGPAATALDTSLVSSDTSVLANQTITIPVGKGCKSEAVALAHVASDTAIALSVTYGAGQVDGSTVVRNFNVGQLTFQFVDAYCNPAVGVFPALVAVDGSGFPPNTTLRFTFSGPPFNPTAGVDIPINGSGSFTQFGMFYDQAGGTATIVVTDPGIGAVLHQTTYETPPWEDPVPACE